ncbi:hypothetical protein H6F43_10220 [Leptolyngbya sp. FACHB-36]|uniref:hypothetical protein n=1 Tax=Leptolyngbya sp. FACHB-36 TaxID=2692808 RepID=UPI001680EE18|nr:hypothetical protein [Leptolyngbya sp. FACHB-36]MBD2020563.1 hypothetical protein [Leptolyngbya sp. FACHB-36]
MPNSFADDELRQASHALAAAFGGVVLVEDATGALQVDALQKPKAPTSSNDSLLMHESLGEPEELDREQLDLFEIPDRQLLVSLSQLRHWYAIARELQRDECLPRIADLGRRFKQAFGDANPDQPQPFTTWSAEDVECWLDDLAQWEQLKGSATEAAIVLRSSLHSRVSQVAQ